MKKTSFNPKSVQINNVIVSTLNRQSLDIKKLMDAIKAADSETSPNFVKLNEIYENIIIDGTLRSVMSKRKSRISNKTLIYSINGKEVETLKPFINNNIFRTFINEILDTISFGHTLIQFDYSKGIFDYKKIERRNVNPKKGIVLIKQTDINGIDYRNDNTLPILEIYSPDTVNKYGLLAVAAQYIIYNRNNAGDWAQHNEIYGQPIREGVYDANDDLGRDKLNKDMTQMGSGAVIIHPKNTEIKLLESTGKSASSDLYNKFDERNEKALTILYLGNNLTTNSGDKGARSLGEVQEKDQDEIIMDDKQFLLGILNSEPFATYFNLFYPEAKAGQFQFIEDKNIDLKTKADIYQIASNHVPIPDDEWYKLMDISIPENLEQLKAQKAEADKKAAEEFQKKIEAGKFQNKGFNFFA